MSDIPHHPYDLPVLWPPNRQRLPQGVLIGKKALGSGLVDQDRQWSFSRVVPGDISTRHQGNTHDVQVPGIDDVGEEAHAAVVFLGTARDPEGPVAGPAQRKGVDEPDPLDPGDLGHPVTQAGVEGTLLQRGVEVLRRVDLPCHGRSRVEPHLHIKGRPEAPGQ